MLEKGAVCRAELSPGDECGAVRGPEAVEVRGPDAMVLRAAETAGGVTGYSADSGLGAVGTAGPVARAAAGGGGGRGAATTGRSPVMVGGTGRGADTAGTGAGGGVTARSVGGPALTWGCASTLT